MNGSIKIMLKNFMMKSENTNYKFEPLSIFKFPQSLGDFNSNGEQEHDYFASEEDGDPVVLTYNNFTINEGHIVTPTNRCKGMYLNILGDLVVNGTLSMTARGAHAEGKYVGIDINKKQIFYSDENNYPDTFEVIDAYGPIVTDSNPINGINGCCGSGGGTYQRKGGIGTSFSGGAGAGGAMHLSSGGIYPGYDGENNGGAGGNGGYRSDSYQAYGGGGGAGNPGGVCTATANAKTRAGQNGTGGLMILFVSGNIIIGENGSIQSNGSKGGNGEAGGSRVRNGSYSGAGSGGGSIHIFYLNQIDNINNIIANGGLCGNILNNYSKNGGNGTVNLVKI